MKTDVFKAFVNTCKTKMPELLTGAGITLYSYAIFASSKAGIAAYKKCEEEQYDNPKDVIKGCWPLYIPTAVAFTAGTVCTSTSDIIYGARLSAAVILSETYMGNLITYKNKVKQIFGEKKEAVVENEIKRDCITSSSDQRKTYDASNLPSMNRRDDGKIWFRDSFGNEFRSTYNAINAGYNKIIANINNGDPQSLADLYYEWNAVPTDFSKSVGWRTKFNISVTSYFDEDGTVVGYIEFKDSDQPVVNYWKWG